MDSVTSTAATPSFQRVFGFICFNCAGQENNVFDLTLSPIVGKLEFTAALLLKKLWEYDSEAVKGHSLHGTETGYCQVKNFWKNYSEACESHRLIPVVVITPPKTRTVSSPATTGGLREIHAFS